MSLVLNGNAPAFSVSRATSAQSITSGVWTKVQLNAENFDTANAFDTTTNYRFQPAVAGYYQINSQVSYGAASGMPYCYAAVYKNGTAFEATVGLALSGIVGNAAFSCLVYLNGSTDYVELYANATGTSVTVSSGGSTTFDGCLVRGT